TGPRQAPLKGGPAVPGDTEPATAVAGAKDAAGVADTADWSARANSAAVANRSAGTGASARWMARSTPTGTLGRPRRTLGTGSVNRFMIIAWEVGPVYGGSPAIIS